MHFDITAFIRVQVDGSAYYPDFVSAAVEIPEVLEVHSITGEGSHIIKVRTRNTTSLERLLSSLQSLPGVHGTSTSIVLSSFKETRTLEASPMDLVEYDAEPA
jgi:Lrp/AsnC family leucine-responsive transcriptional regulator